MNIYAGNLSRQTTEEDLKKEFEAFGQVESVNIIKDKFTGESSGFGFVSMPSRQEAQKAIDELNGKELMDRVIKVAEAKPKTDRSRRGGGGRFGGGRGGSRGGGGGRGERRGGERRRF
jgi:RNA recognition motif-containing protein